MTLRIVKDGHGLIVDRDSPAHRYWLARGYVEERAEDAPAPAEAWSHDDRDGAVAAVALAEVLDRADAASDRAASDAKASRGKPKA